MSKAIDAWNTLLADANAGKNVAENIIHGLVLQRLKMQFYLFLEHVQKQFDADDLPSLKELHDIANDIGRLVRDFELAKYKTKALYEKVMYDEEVAVELNIRFEKPLGIINKLGSFLKMLSAELDTIAGLISSVAGKKEMADEKTLGHDFSLFYAGFSRAVIGSMNSGKRFPGIDAMDKLAMDAETVLSSASNSNITGIIATIAKKCKDLHDPLDEFLLEVARFTMQLPFFGKF